MSRANECLNLRLRTPVADSLDCSDVQSGASESSSWVEGPPCASCCTFPFKWLMNSELSRGGCQRGFFIVKCIRDNSVLPFSACWYTDASVWPSDIHCNHNRKHMNVNKTLITAFYKSAFPFTQKDA